MTIKTKGGVIVQADDGSPSEDCDCCGGGTTCPTDCSACAVTLDVTITGSSGGCDGTFTLTKTTSVWVIDNPCVGISQINLSCEVAFGGWTVRIITEDGPVSDRYGASSYAACPPTGSYTVISGSGTCSIA